MTQVAKSRLPSGAAMRVAAAGVVLCLIVTAAAAQNPFAPPNQALPKDPKASPESKPAPGGSGDANASKRTALKAPGSSVPTDPVMRARLLRDLYAMLATAEDQTSATTITTAIERLWQAGAGDTVSVLLDRAVKAAAGERPDLALRLLGTVTRIAPDYPEGFNRRAFVYYSMNELELALGDLRRVIALDPNHYKALEGLAQILREIDQKKAALEVYRRLISVHPHWSGTKTVVEELERTVGGQGT
jgi:tetratricopeptide (TPR) repeat protein